MRVRSTPPGRHCQGFVVKPAKPCPTAALSNACSCPGRIRSDTDVSSSFIMGSCVPMSATAPMSRSAGYSAQHCRRSSDRLHCFSPDMLSCLLSPTTISSSFSTRSRSPHYTYHCCCCCCCCCSYRAISFPQACISATLFLVATVQSSPNNHVGTRIGAVAAMLGPVWLGCAVSGIMVRHTATATAAARAFNVLYVTVHFVRGGLLS